MSREGTWASARTGPVWVVVCLLALTAVATNRCLASEPHHHSKGIGVDEHSGEGDRKAPKMVSDPQGSGANIVPQTQGGPLHNAGDKGSPGPGSGKPDGGEPHDDRGNLDGSGRRKADRHAPDTDRGKVVRPTHGPQPSDHEAGDRRAPQRLVNSVIEQLRLDAAEGDRHRHDVRKINVPPVKGVAAGTINPQWVAHLHRQPPGAHEWQRRNAIGIMVTAPTPAVTPGLVRHGLPGVAGAAPEHGEPNAHPADRDHAFVPAATGTPAGHVNAVGLGGAPRVNGTGIGHLGTGPATLGGRARDLASINGTGFRSKP